MISASLPNSEPDPEYPVWDRFVRSAHWYLPVGIAVMWWSGETGRMDIHQWVGLSLLCVVTVRLLWGFVGSEAARFTHFLAPPPLVWRYVRGGGQYAGHNPLGGWAVLAMLLLLFIQGVSGLFSQDDLLFDGPLSYWAGERSGMLTEWHLINWLVVQALVGVHLLAVAWYQWWRNQPLIQAMWRGKAGHKASATPPQPLWIAMVLMLITALALWGLLAIAPQAPSYY